jgi:3-hydroxybutyryl-CoA dehydrogenase
MKKTERVGIVGAGTMGQRIGFGCVISGIETHLFDICPDALEVAARGVRSLIADREKRGTLSAGTAQSAMARLTVCPTLEACVVHTDLVIETVPENVELKRQVFASIDKHADASTLIGTNTSSIPGSWLATATRRPDKIFNVNFGGPDDRKVELMGHSGTSPETMKAVVAFVCDLGLVPIVVNGENVGYALNRVWRAVKKEVLSILERGYLTAEEVDRGWMLDWGVRIGPCGLMDQIGLDVVRDIEMIYYRASGDPSDQPPPVLHRMIEAGKLGVKTGEGFYKYPNPAYEHPDFVEGSHGSKTIGQIP